MKKLLSLGLVAGTVTSLAACGGKKEVKPTTDKKTTTDTKKETKKTVTFGKVAKGTYKIGSVSTGIELSAALSPYLKSVDGDAKAGLKYLDLPSGLFLSTASEYNISEKNIPDSDAANKATNKKDQIKLLSDKTKLAARNLDTLFIKVKDEVHNSEDVYKALVGKKQFGDTNIIMFGKKAKSQDGASSKVFAGGKISTATYNKYAAAYIAGFQSAVAMIKYSGSEDAYDETQVSFLIGATTDSEHKKKAYAFRRGVEAAASHKLYSKFLKARFVSKSADTSKSSKKLYREVSEWIAKDDNKSKLYEFSSSDTFTDSDKRVVYIAGTKIEDWKGMDKISGSVEATFDAKGELLTEATLISKAKAINMGLIGALYNAKDNAESSSVTISSVKSKTFGKGVQIVLDTPIKGKLQEITYENTKANAFERYDVKLLGFVGKEKLGEAMFVEFALHGLYMGGPNYMLGKHTIFGSPLHIAGTQTGDKTIHEVMKSAKTGTKDSDSKAKDRYKTSLKAAISMELMEADIVKAAPWIK